MLSPDNSHLRTSLMAKRSNVRRVCLFLAGAFMVVLFLWSFFSVLAPSPSPYLWVNDPHKKPTLDINAEMRRDPPDPTFYDDPDVSYSIENPIRGWDEKRRRWLELHPLLATGSSDRVVLITGSQPRPCENPIGDHLLLRCFKNKVDYSRIHGYQIFYSNALLHPKMNSFWAKLPIVRAAMIAHPEAEWMWWIDSDAIITDIDFSLPLNRYRNHNLVVNGWPNLLFENRSWVALNAGVFLIRNCQWSMDFIDVWATMSPMSPDYKKWGPIQQSVFKDKMNPESDDQTALLYLLYKDKDKYYDKVYIETEYDFQGYWSAIVEGYDNFTARYLNMEENDAILRRRHAEVVTKLYGAHREEKHVRSGEIRRRPFVTHFTGCQPCSGHHNEMYKGDSCSNGMIRALNFADNQVMRNYGFVHPDLLKTSPMDVVPFDYPNEAFWG